MDLTKSISVISIIRLVFSLMLITSSAASRHKRFQILDVSASLQQARQVFSPNPARTSPTNPSAESLSLTLHSRSSSPSNYDNNNNNNYTSLTLSRLARDEARVNSLLSRHSRALCSRSGCSCKSLRSPRQLKSPVVSGTAQGSGEYFSWIGMGRPVKEYYMVLDSGSDITWLQCQPCLDCYKQSDPIYDPKSSSTYKPLPCTSRQCKALEDSGACLSGNCLYEVSYGDGSSTVGDFATETISFGSSGSVPDVAIGCGHDNEGLYAGAAGLLGLGGGALSLPSQINATSFSYCLVNRDSDSSSTLDFNSTAPNDSVLAPLLSNSVTRTYRYVGLTGISIGGQPVRFPSSLFAIAPDGSGGVIVDSGTTVTRLREEVYILVRDKFRAMSRNLRFAGELSLFDTCYDLGSLSKAKVPTVSLQFSGRATLKLPASNYMIPVDDSGKFCFAFAASFESLSIIGNVQQQGMRVTYNLAKKNIGFSPNKC